MKTKKILSLVVAAAMMFAMSVNALASSDIASSASSDTVHNVRYTGGTKLPTLNIVVTGTNSVLAFNPYKLAVSVDANGVPDQNGQGTMDDQLISKPIVIRNLTNAPLKMEGSLNVKVGGTEATLSNKTIAATETTKKIYCYADFYTYDDGDFSNLPELTKKATTAQRLVAAKSGEAVKHTTANRLTVQATDQTNPNYVFVKVNAEATKNPATTWKASDTVTVDMTFTFTTDGNYDKYAVVYKAVGVGDNDNGSAFTVQPVYSSSDVKQEPNTSNTDDITDGDDIDELVVAGATCVVYPALDSDDKPAYKITKVLFYDKQGKNTVTTTKATSTDTKNPSAPWTFTMPADNVVIEVTTTAVSS